MSGFQGMDIGQVRQLARQLTSQADQINQIASQLTTQLSSTDWKGPDSERFRSDWNSQHRTALSRVTEALQQAAQSADRNANEQEQASGN